MHDLDLDRWEELLAAEVTRKMQEIPIAERHKRLLPPFVYAEELAAEHPATGDAVNPEHARKVVHDHAAPKFFRDMFDPRRPFFSRWVLDQATEIGWKQVRKKQHLFKQYGGNLPSADDCRGYAFDALLELGMRMSDQSREEVRDPYGFLCIAIGRLIGRDIDLNIRKHQDPGLRRHYSVALKFRKRLELDNPLRDADEIEEEALRLADEALELYEMLYRVDFEEADDFAEEIDFSDLAHSKQTLNMIEELLQKPPFTDIDRYTWALWRAVGFAGLDIDWEAAGVKSSTGAQRLHALVLKLRKLLSDLGYDA